MSGLILKLRPHEELMINGVVVENGDRKTRLRVKTDGAHILRLRDAIRPEDATTPLKRAYYIAQLAVAGQLPKAEAAEMIVHALKSFGGPQARLLRRDIADCAKQQDYYKAMRRLRTLLAGERTQTHQPASQN